MFRLRTGLLLAFALLLTVLSLLAPGNAGAQSTTGGFNHDSTMFPLRGAHEVVRCETCHINGIFKGTPRQCNLCHVQGSRTSALPMTINHIPVTDQCDVCHNSSTFSGTQFTHVAVGTGTCNMCHNGYYAQGMGKQPPHPFTTASCDVCHSVGAFLPAVQFDHAGHGITPAPFHTGPACDSCHNGSKAVGKPPTHVPTPPGAACDDCHLQTTAWRPALFNHEAVGIAAAPQTGPACNSCHNGKYSIGKPGGTAHIPTTQDCALCHNNTPIKNPGGFSLGQMNHTGITNNCALCHAANSPYPPLAGKAVSTPKSIPNHIPFGTAACESCHLAPPPTSGSTVAGGAANDTWAGAVMNHSVVSSMTCESCHEDGANLSAVLPPLCLTNSYCSLSISNAFSCLIMNPPILLL